MAIATTALIRTSINSPFLTSDNPIYHTKQHVLFKDFIAEHSGGQNTSPTYFMFKSLEDQISTPSTILSQPRLGISASMPVRKAQHQKSAIKKTPHLLDKLRRS